MKITKEIVIALVAIAALVVLFFGIKFLKGLTLFSSDTAYYMTFSDISGLSASSPIYADGYRVGVVKRIDYDYTQKRDIRVEVGIEPSLRIPKGSTAEIVSDLLGNVQVNLLMANNPRERIEAGGLIEGQVNSGAMGQLKGMVPAVERMLPKLDSILGSLNALLADPALGQSVAHVQTLTGNLTQTTAELNVLLRQLNKDVPPLMAKAGGVLDQANRLAGHLDGKLADVDVETTMAQVRSTLENVQRLTDQMQGNEGALGLLMNDPALYNNLNATMVSADSLLVNFRQHPKRYIHFSVFGKKDK